MAPLARAGEHLWPGDWNDEEPMVRGSVDIGVAEDCHRQSARFQPHFRAARQAHQPLRTEERKLLLEDSRSMGLGRPMFGVNQVGVIISSQECGRRPSLHCAPTPGMPFQNIGPQLEDAPVEGQVHPADGDLSWLVVLEPSARKPTNLCREVQNVQNVLLCLMIEMGEVQFADHVFVLLNGNQHRPQICRSQLILASQVEHPAESPLDFGNKKHDRFEGVSLCLLTVSLALLGLKKPCAEDRAGAQDRLEEGGPSPHIRCAESLNREKREPRKNKGGHIRGRADYPIPTLRHLRSTAQLRVAVQ